MYFSRFLQWKWLERWVDDVNFILQSIKLYNTDQLPPPVDDDHLRRVCFAVWVGVMSRMGWFTVSSSAILVLA